MTTTSNFVGIGPTTNTNPEVDQRKPTNQVQGGGDSVRLMWAVDAYLWLAFGVCLVLIAIEKWFNVMSGFTLLIGATPALLLGLALIFGGAAYMAATTRAGARMAAAMAPVRFPTWARTPAPRPAYAQDAPRWKVRTTPRPAATGKRSAASRRVMDMEV